jgi:hypothetical protein
VYSPTYGGITGTANRRRIYTTWNEAGKQAGLPASVFCKATHDLENRKCLLMCRFS